MATVIVDWLKLRDQLTNLASVRVANEIVSCIRSGRKFEAARFPELAAEELLQIASTIIGARAAIASTRAGH